MVAHGALRPDEPDELCATLPTTQKVVNRPFVLNFMAKDAAEKYNERKWLDKKVPGRAEVEH